MRRHWVSGRTVNILISLRVFRQFLSAQRRDLSLKLAANPTPHRMLEMIKMGSLRGAESIEGVSSGAEKVVDVERGSVAEAPNAEILGAQQHEQSLPDDGSRFIVDLMARRGARQ